MTENNHHETADPSGNLDVHVVILTYIDLLAYQLHKEKVFNGHHLVDGLRRWANFPQPAIRSNLLEQRAKKLEYLLIAADRGQQTNAQ